MTKMEKREIVKQRDTKIFNERLKKKYEKVVR